VTPLLVSSAESVQSSSTTFGPTYSGTDSVGAGGGVVSGGVLYVTVLLSREGLPFMSTARTTHE